jgi:hypothetical protein
MTQKKASAALYSSPATPRELFSALAAGAVLLLVVHGLGRFMYTPLLPYLVNDGLFSAADGAAVATWNYMGYLMGAVLAIRWHRIDHIRRILPLAIVVHIATTVLVAVETDLTAISTTRWRPGVPGS